MVRWFSVGLLLFLLLLAGFSQAGADFHKACDGFVLLADESESMFSEDVLCKKPKIEIEKEILTLINQDIPPADFVAALRTFGHDYAFSRPFQSVLYYPVGPYQKDKMAQAIEKIRASRSPTPLGYGLEMAAKDAASMPGRVHIVLFTDGNENAYRPSVEVAQEIKEKYPGKICLYVVQIGHCQKSRARLEKLISIIGCGKLYKDSDLTDANLRRLFIREVFGYEKPAPPVTKVTPKDSDGDGVYDQDDRCPNTPRGAHVDQYGCWKMGLILFEFDKTDIAPRYYATLEEIARVLKLNPDLRLKIIGATDAVGSEEYNYKLGLRRAEKVKNFLVSRGVSPSQLIVISVGEKAPIAVNDSEAGRAQNRYVRFELVR